MRIFGLQPATDRRVRLYDAVLTLVYRSLDKGSWRAMGC